MSLQVQSYINIKQDKSKKNQRQEKALNRTKLKGDSLKEEQ